MIKNKNKSSIKSYVVGDEVLNRAKVAKIYESRVILEKDGRFEYIDIEKFELKRRRGGSKKKKSSGPSLTRIATSPLPKHIKKQDLNETVWKLSSRMNIREIFFREAI